MSIKRITINDNEEYLRQVSSDVDLADSNLKKWIDDLDEYCSENKCFAMAAVQIGIPKRIIYLKNTTLDLSIYDDSNYNERQVMINPVIISCSGLTKYWENCASCGNNLGLVSRPYRAEVEYYDENFEKKRKKFEGFETTVFFHEFDHLNGILHIDKAEELLPYNEEERIEFRKTHPYEVISSDCEFLGYCDSGKVYVNK